MIIEAVAVNVLFLTDLAESNLKSLSEADILVISETIDQNIELQQLHQFLALNDYCRHTKTLNLHVSQSLSFTQEALPRAIIQSVSQVFSMVQEAVHETKKPLVEQQLVMTDLAEVEVAKAAFDTLVMTDIAIAQVIYGPQVNQTLVMTQGATVYKASSCWVNGDFSVMGP